jgi:hypothetical protein
MKTLILTGLLALTTVAASQPAAAIILRPTLPCGMTALCKPLPAPLPPRGYRP